MRKDELYRWMQTAALAALALLLPGSGGVPCVPEGGSVDVPFHNPDFEQQAKNAPFGGTLVAKTAHAMEQDPGFDDDLGPGTIGESVTTVTISNEGGNLKGPSGETGDGWPGRKDCFEVYMVWCLYFVVPDSWGVYGGVGGLGPDGDKFGGGGFKKSGVREYRFCIPSSVIEVCPC